MAILLGFCVWGLGGIAGLFAEDAAPDTAAGNGDVPAAAQEAAQEAGEADLFSGEAAKLPIPKRTSMSFYRLRVGNG